MRFISIRERYSDLRYGWSMIAPAFGFSNFLMLAYLTFAKNTLPLEIFAPIFGASLVSALTVLGRLLRQKQLKVDAKLNYEQQTESAKTVRIMMDDIHEIQKRLDIPISEESKRRRDYMNDIERR